MNVQRHNMGRTRKNRKNVRRILLQLRIMLADSCSDVGHFWELDQRRHSTEIILVNQMETGTGLLNEGCSTLQKAVIFFFLCHQRPEKRRIKKQSKG